MGTLLWILLIVVVALAALLAYAATRPDTFSLSRSIAINAPAARIFPLIADFREWTKLSPWEKLDPALQRAYSGAERGVGAVYEWEGAKAGQGRMEIAEAPEPSRVRIKLDFIKPFPANNVATFELAERGGATTVTWSMSGPQAFMGKVVSVFMSMDKIVGRSFEQGLADLKRVSEAA